MILLECERTADTRTAKEILNLNSLSKFEFTSYYSHQTMILKL